MRLHSDFLACVFALAPISCAAQSTLQGHEVIPRYELEIRVDPDGRRLEGRGTVWLPARNEPREVIGFGLAASIRDFVAEVLEPEENVGPVTLERGFPGGRGGWVVRPERPFPAGRPVRLRLAWQGGEQASFVFYLGPEGSFASGVNTAWYPVPAGGLVTGTLRVDVPAGLSVHANGRQRILEEERKRGVFRFEHVTPAFFAFAAGNIRSRGTMGRFRFQCIS
jgi:hypothetical protein